MLKKIVSGIMLTLLLIGMLTIASGIQSVEPEQKTCTVDSARFKHLNVQEAKAVLSSSNDDWPMFHHDLTHTGYSTSTAPNTNYTIWSYKTGGRVYYSSPAVADGRVYIGSEDEKVYCLNASTGAKIWSYTTGSPVYSSPAVADGKVFVGSYSDDDNVYCLDASTGALIWNYTTVGPVWSSPAVAYGKVYVGSDHHKVYALDASTGAFIWSYTTGAWFVRSSPAVAYGRVYIGSDDGNVYCLDASTGAHIWSYTTGHSVESSPAVADGKIYIGSSDYRVYCLDASNGTKIWSYKTGDSVESSPAVADGRVYIGSFDNKVYAFESPPGIHDVAVTNVKPSKTVVGQSYSASVNVTIQNQGNFTETFNVTAYANETVMDTITEITLTSGSFKTLTFTWNTTGFAKGNYTISAVADIVPGETDTADNTYIDGFVIVAMVGDITGPDGWPDGKVDIRDVAAVAILYGVNYPDSDYNPNCDINNDLKIDIKDVAIVAKHYGDVYT